MNGCAIGNFNALASSDTHARTSASFIDIIFSPLSRLWLFRRFGAHPDRRNRRFPTTSQGISLSSCRAHSSGLIIVYCGKFMIHDVVCSGTFLAIRMDAFSAGALSYLWERGEAESRNHPNIEINKTFSI